MVGAGRKSLRLPRWVFAGTVSKRPCTPQSCQHLLEVKNPEARAASRFVSRLDRARQSFRFGNRCTNSQQRPAILRMVEDRREPASERYTESSPWPVRRRYPSQYPRGSLGTIRHSMLQQKTHSYR